jgi:adenylate cyclase
LLSSDFVAAGTIPAESLGVFSLKGVGIEQEIYLPVLTG